ncbi:MAG: hypothetical protein OEU36_22575, partial [Gammaproteobacteria bacterium]|nr:hypothetical protein [Gammaproteobacteria bacterium]
EQTSRCEPQVRLLVHPSVGDIDSEKLLNTFLQALCGGSSGARFMEMQWRQAGVVRISREAPRTTASGKVLHLHRDVSGAVCDH